MVKEKSDLPLTDPSQYQESAGNGSQSKSRLRAFALLALLLFTGYRFACNNGRMSGYHAKNPDDIQPYWAQYRPYTPAGKYSSPSKSCRVTQVNLIQRHGARYPTSDDPLEMEDALLKLQSVKKYKDDRLKFLRHHSYFLGQDDLVPLGAEQSFQSGQTMFERYPKLVGENNLPFVRASGSQRVVDSATNWTAGFATASHYEYRPLLSLVIPEDKNNTLDDDMCPNAGSDHPYSHKWRSVFMPPITARLNKDAPGANLNDSNAFSLMSLCPLESVALSMGNAEMSAFCGLFSKKEWKGFEYYEDLKKYYGRGYGQELGPVQGVGYVNELLARLTGQPVQDNTQTNRTLDSSPDTFPLNRSIYADFSHEDSLIAIYAAIGLFQQTKDLDPHKIGKKKRTWVTSRLVPFSARMVVERLMCENQDTPGGEDWVRILVNDEMQPLEFCGKGNGMCTLEDFVKSQRYATNNGDGDFEKCYD